MKYQTNTQKAINGAVFLVIICLILLSIVVFSQQKPLSCPSSKILRLEPVKKDTIKTKSNGNRTKINFHGRTKTPDLY